MAFENQRYVTFQLESETYGLPIDCVESIVPFQEITKLPRMPKFLAGVFTVRGSVLPVMDLRVRMGLEKMDDKSSCRIVIASLNELRVGLIVNTVKNVEWVTEEQVEFSIPVVTSEASEFIEGIAKKEGSLIILLSLPKMFSDKERTNLEKVAAAATQKAA